MAKSQNSFFEYRYLHTDGLPISVSCGCKITSDGTGYAPFYLSETVRCFGKEGESPEITLSTGIPEAVINAVGSEHGDHDESYAIVVSFDGSRIDLYGSDERGRIYAVSTLKHLAEKGDLKKNMILFDYPDMKIRGYHVFTPGRKSIPLFKQMIDMLVYYKYNAVMMEIGGAMEYMRRPEINRTWEEYCKELGSVPEGAFRAECMTYPWAKDSIHTDNGDGSYITQDEMKDVISYCRERGLDVVPEVPSLSHSDYIVKAYPELNERKEDMYPDSYCPSNPKTYEVLFDILDEVIEVFKPEYLNIGHDEYYSSAKCELCKNKLPVDLYVEDIVKINGYLKTKNVKTMMWGDKLFAQIGETCGDQYIPYGGAPNPAMDIPALYECKGRVPKDITLLNWYWDLSPIEEEKEIFDLGYSMLFGNFGGARQDDYRVRKPMYNGGYVGNWGKIEEQYMQRNRQNFDLVTTAYVFFSENYNDKKDRADLIEKTKKELYGRYKNSLHAERIIEVDHTTEFKKNYRFFYDGVLISNEDWLIGNYTITYTDGTKANLPVIYGYNIRSSENKNKAAFDCDTSVEGIEPIGASYPYWENGKIWYRTAYADPYPEKQIKSIEFVSVDKENIQVERKGVNV